MIKTLVAPPPKETPLLDAAGRLTAPWVIWLSSIPAAASTLQAGMAPVVWGPPGPGWQQAVWG